MPLLAANALETLGVVVGTFVVLWSIPAGLLLAIDFTLWRGRRRARAKAPRAQGDAVPFTHQVIAGLMALVATVRAGRWGAVAYVKGRLAHDPVPAAGPARDVRVVTFNTAAGNPRITTPQASFLELPFYREALDGASDAPLLALQEVGDDQARALRQVEGGGAHVLQLRRPGLGNALVVPARYELLSARRGYYVISQLHGIADALRWWHEHGRAPDWRQFGELRIWIEAHLRDRESRRTFTVLTTHLSVEPSLKRRQAEAIMRRARAASRRGPVILAGDLNVPATGASGRDVEIAAVLSALEDMGAAERAGRPDIDYVLAGGFVAVSSKRWTGDSLALPGSPNAETVSDHYAEDDLLRFG